MTSDKSAREHIYAITRSYLRPENPRTVGGLLQQLARDWSYGEGEDAVAELVYQRFSEIKPTAALSLFSGVETLADLERCANQPPDPLFWWEDPDPEHGGPRPGSNDGRFRG